MGVLQTLLVIVAAWQTSLALHRSMSPKELHHIFGDKDVEKIPEYWLDKPRKTAHPENDSHFLYNISYRGREEVFRLQPHKRLFGEEFHMIMRDANASAMEFSLADQDCTYQGESLDDPDVKIALVGCGDRMHGMILSTLDSTPFLIQPHSKGDEHVIHKRSIDHVLQKHSCLFNPKDDPYPEDHLPITRRSALFPDQHPNRMAVMKPASLRRSPAKLLPIKKEEDLTIELAVFADDAMWRHFVELYGGHADAEMHRFILAAVNNIDILYGQRVINPSVSIKIVRYEVIKTPPASLAKAEHKYGDVDRLLDAFCDYQAQLNPAGDEDPKHWDHALLFSGYDLYRDGLKTVAGYAPVKGMCSETRSCTINEGLDFGSVFVVTHEMGHSLGMYHDGDNECDLRCCIMSPSVGTGKTQWSSCSVKEFSLFVTKLGTPARAPNCLRDLPTPGEADKAFFKDRESPGQQFTLGEQCAVFHGECWKHELRDGQSLEEVCEMVWCGNGEGIIRTAHPALEGTNCGPNLWCRNGQCVPSTHSLPQIDGQWGTWNESPSACRAKCSECEIVGQMQLRRSTRLCNRPAANNGGRECVGDDARGIVCDSRPCGGQRVDEYATSTCTKLKNDPDNPNPQLSGVGLQFEQAPCKIWCQLELSNNIRTVSNFPDGTPCGDGNYCVKGECRPLLCNGKAVAETEQECPYGVRYRVPSTPQTTTWPPTTTRPPQPRTRPSMAPQARRISNLQRFVNTQGSMPAARRLQLTTRQPPRQTTRFTHRVSGSTPARFFMSTLPPATRRPPMWSLWSEWSECLTVGCGEKGIKVRIRRCVGDQNQYIRDDTCRGHNRETARCMGEPCAKRRVHREMDEQSPDSASTPSTTTTETASTMTASNETTTTPLPHYDEDETLVIELQDDVREVSMTTTSMAPPAAPSTTTINPRLAKLLPKGSVVRTTTTEKPLLVEDEEEYLEPPSANNEEFVRRASVKREERRVDEEEIHSKISGESPQSDEVVDVPAPSLERSTKGEKKESTPSGDGFQLQEKYIDSEDDVIDIPQPRSNRGGRRVKDWEENEGRAPSSSKYPELIDVPADYRVRNMPVRQFIPDPLNPTRMIPRNVAIRQLLPYTGSLETLPGPNPGLNPAQINPRDPSDPLNLRGGIENLASLFKPLFPQQASLGVPTAPPPLVASTLPEDLIPIAPPPPPPSRIDKINQRAVAGNTVRPIQPVHPVRGGATLPGRIRVYPGPPPSDDEVLALFKAETSSSPAKITDVEEASEKQYEKKEDLEILPSPVDDDRLPLEDLNDEVIEISPSSPTTGQTPTEGRTLPPIYYQNQASDSRDDAGKHAIQGDQQVKTAAAAADSAATAARVPKEVREGDYQRKDYIILSNPSSAPAPRFVPLYGTPSPVQQQPHQPTYVAAGSGQQYAAAAQPSGVRTVYIVKGGTFGNFLANGSPSPSFTTAGYSRPSTPAYPVPKYRTAGGNVTPAKVIIYGQNPSYATTTPSYPSPIYSTPPTYTVAATYSPPPPSYPTPEPYKPPPPEWGPWSPCSVTCGNGTRTRNIDSCGGENTIVVSSTPSSETTRVAIVDDAPSSTPSYALEPFCVETEICVLEPCWRYSEWSDWNGCSKECGMGFSLRRRTCVLGVCPGPFSESSRCEGTNCEEPSIWGEWGDWSGCSATCGLGTKARERVCQTKRCLGSNREARRCHNPAICNDKPSQPEEELEDRSPSVPLIDPVTAPPVPPIINYVEKDWQPWNTCSTSCGLGTQVRRHRTTSRVQHRSCFLVSCNDFGL